MMLAGMWVKWTVGTSKKKQTALFEARDGPTVTLQTRGDISGVGLGIGVQCAKIAMIGVEMA